MSTRGEFFDADKMAARLMAGEAPVLRTGPSPVAVLGQWMEASGEPPGHIHRTDPQGERYRCPAEFCWHIATGPHAAPEAGA